MRNIRLAFIGFGNVAQGLTQILRDKNEQFRRQWGCHFSICAISDPLKGCAYSADGLDPSELLDAVQQKGTIQSVSSSNTHWDALELIQNCPADVVIEMSYTNLETGEPSTSYMIEAMRRKKHVVTTNKGPVALHYDLLEEIAQQNGVKIGIEGTVMSGTPALYMGRELLAAARIERIQGILNGTSNYILSQMETGKSYTESLEEAQALGYAEANPRGDVEGFDAAAKVAILGRFVLGMKIQFSEIKRIGITHLTMEDILQANQSGMHWKLVGTLDQVNGNFTAAVEPLCLPDSHPLARISGVTNAIVYTTQLLGDVTLAGPGAGRLETGYAIIQDLLRICQN